MVLRWWLLLTVFTLIGPAISYAALHWVTPVYRAGATVVVAPRSPRVMDDMRPVVDIPDGGWRVFEPYMETQIAVIKTRAVTLAALDSERLWTEPALFDQESAAVSARVENEEDMRARMADMLIRRLRVARLPDSLTLSIQFEHEDPIMAARVASALAHAYVRHNLRLKDQLIEQASVELAAIVEQRGDLREAAESAARRYAERHDIGGVDARRQEATAARTYFNHRVLDATRDMIAAQARWDRILQARKRGMTGLAVEHDLASRALSELRVLGVTLEKDLAEIKLVYGPKHDKWLAVNKQLKQVRGAIRKETRGIVEAARARYDVAVARHHALKEQFEAARDEDTSLAGILAEHDRLIGEVERQTELHDRVRLRHQETLIARGVAQAANNVRVLQAAAIPERPTYPRRAPIMLASAIFGLFLGFVLVVMFERGDRTIKTGEQLEQVSGFPCLGTAPHLTGARHEVSEEVRALRAQLLFVTEQRELTSLLVTGAAAGCGRTTVALQLATSLALADRKVVLVEADMRRPAMNGALGLPEGQGLSGWLAGHTTAVEELLQSTPVENMHLIASGPRPENPAELLNSLRLNQLLARLRGRFDTVIVDSPPLATVSDGLAVATRVDGVLMVARAGVTTGEQFAESLRALTALGSPIVGTVLNDVR